MASLKGREAAGLLESQQPLLPPYMPAAVPVARPSRWRSALLAAVVALLSAAVVLGGFVLGGFSLGGFSLVAPVRFSVSGGTPFIRPFELELRPGSTVRDLYAAAARTLGVPVDYVVLSKSDSRSARSRPEGVRIRDGNIPRLHSQDLLSDYLKIDSTDYLTAESVRDLVVKVRPLRGDHLHYLFSIFINGKRVSKLYDRPLQSFVYEGLHLQQVFPHIGLHAGASKNWFDDSNIHAHPGTSSQWFRLSEGFGANLGAYLEQIGVWVWEDESFRYPFHRPFGAPRIPEYEVALDMPNSTTFVDGTPVNSNIEWGEEDYDLKRTIVWGPRPTGNVTAEAPRWRVYYYSHYTSSDPTILERDFERIWLHENYGRIVLAFDVASYRPPAPSQEEIDYMTVRYGIYKGFDGEPYPMPNARFV